MDVIDLQIALTEALDRRLRSAPDDELIDHDRNLVRLSKRDLDVITQVWVDAQ